MSADTLVVDGLLRYRVDVDGCWIWAGYAAANGYGRVYNRARGKIEWVHRYSYELARGQIATGYELDHECQVTLCVNPNHLAMVTRAEHIRRTMARLGKDDLHLAAARLRSSGLTYSEIAQALQLAGKGSAYSAVQSAVTKGLIDPAEVPRSRHLTEPDREDIRLLYAMGVPQTVIGEFYRVDSSQISRICNGKTSGHVAGRAGAA